MPSPGFLAKDLIEATTVGVSCCGHALIQRVADDALTFHCQGLRIQRNCVDAFDFLIHLSTCRRKLCLNSSVLPLYLLYSQTAAAMEDGVLVNCSPTPSLHIYASTYVDIYTYIYIKDMFTNIKDMFTNSCEQLLKLLDLVPRQVLENELSTSPRDILLLGVSRHDGPSRAPQRLNAMDLVPNSLGGRVLHRQITRICPPENKTCIHMAKDTQCQCYNVICMLCGM